MPLARTTNNSVSTLEEQSDIIKTMSEKAEKVVKASGKSDQSKKKAKKPAAPTSGQQAEPGPGQAPGTSGSDNVSNQAAEPAPLDAVTGNGLQPLPPHLPMLYPQPQHMGFPGAYPQQFLPYPPPYGPPYQFGGEGWEEETVASYERQSTHNISDDEDEVQSVGSEAVEEKGKRNLDFSKLKPGKMASLLKEQHKKVKDEDRVSQDINDELAGVFDGFFEDTRPGAELERLCKAYPRVKNLENQVVPKLDTELFTAIDHLARTADVSMQTLQKGVVAAISALAPVTALILSRGETDEELDELSGNALEALQLLALTSVAMSNRRRELLKPYLQHTYARALTRAPEGVSQWLYGGTYRRPPKSVRPLKEWRARW